MFFKALSSFLQLFLDAVVASINILFTFFPSSPFTFVSNSQFAGLLADINYFIPIGEFVTITEAWLVGVAAYYIYSIWARWIKAID